MNGDPLTYAPEKLAYRLERLLNERRLWDEPPELGFLYRHEKGGIRAEALPIPGSSWEGDPKVLLRAMVNVLAEAGGPWGWLADTLRKMATDSFVGIYLRTEGWAPPEDQADEVERRRKAGGSIPRFEGMRGRIECRMMTAVDFRGTLYMGLHRRPDRNHHPVAWEGGGAIVEGDIPALLLRLIMALKEPAAG